MKTRYGVLTLIFSLCLMETAISGSESYSLSANNTRGLHIQINAGEKITIQASGAILTNPNGNIANCDIYTSANGLNSCSYNTSEASKLHNMPFMSLIGNVNGQYYYIGSNFVNTFSTNSVINLTVNDWDLSDNSGVLTILVTREEEQQCADTNGSTAEGIAQCKADPTSCGIDVNPAKQGLISISPELKFHINKISYESSILWADFAIFPHEEKILFEVVKFAEVIGEDEDGDGYTVDEGDCNDSDDTINPGAKEILGDSIHG